MDPGTYTEDDVKIEAQMHREEGHVKKEAVIGAVGLQSKKCQGLAANTKSRKWLGRILP